MPEEATQAYFYLRTETKTKYMGQCLLLKILFSTTFPFNWKRSFVLQIDVWPWVSNAPFGPAGTA